METLSTLSLPDPPATDDNAVLCRHWHGVMIAHGRMTLEAAARLGDVLCEQKQLSRGRFKAWCEEHLPFSYKTATKYMKLAKNPALLADYIASIEGEGTIRGALEYVAPKSEPGSLSDDEPEIEHVTECNIPDSAIVSTCLTCPDCGAEVDGPLAVCECKAVEKEAQGVGVSEQFDNTKQGFVDANSARLATQLTLKRYASDDPAIIVSKAVGTTPQIVEMVAAAIYDLSVGFDQERPPCGDVDEWRSMFGLVKDKLSRCGCKNYDATLRFFPFGDLMFIFASMQPERLRAQGVINAYASAVDEFREEVEEEIREEFYADDAQTETAAPTGL